MTLGLAFGTAISHARGLLFGGMVCVLDYHV